MKIKNILLGILIFSLPFSLQAQQQRHDRKMRKAKYGFYPRGLRSSKRELIAFLKAKSSETKLMNRKFDFCLRAGISGDWCKAHIPARDSIRELFRIVDITTRTENFRLEKGKLKRVDAYLIQVESLSDTLYPWRYLRILSIDEDRENNEKIEVGGTYPLLLISLFDRDCCHVYDKNGEIVGTVGGNRTSFSIFFENAWWLNLLASFNYYSTPNLKGLYYTPPE